MGSTARYHQFFKFVNITTGKEYLLDDITGSLTEATNKIENLEQRLQNISSAYIYKVTVADFTTLPTTADVGNVYNVEDDGMNYAWTGSEWDALGPTIDLTPYAKVSALTEHESASATTDSLGHVTIASSMDDTATPNVPNASLVKSYVGNITSPILTSINETQTSLTSYITENNNRVVSIEGDITTKYNELKGLIDTTETALTTSLTSYQTSTDSAIQTLTGSVDSLTQTVADNKTNTDTSIQALTSEVNSLTQTVETNKNSTDSSIQTLSSSVYTKDEVDEKFRTNKGYIILRDYETV